MMSVQYDTGQGMSIPVTRVSVVAQSSGTLGRDLVHLIRQECLHKLLEQLGVVRHLEVQQFMDDGFSPEMSRLAQCLGVRRETTTVGAACPLAIRLTEAGFPRLDADVLRPRQDLSPEDPGWHRLAGWAKHASVSNAQVFSLSQT